MTMTEQMSNRASVHSPCITIPVNRDWVLIRHIGPFVIFKVVHLKRTLTKGHRGSRFSTDIQQAVGPARTHPKQGG